MSIDWIHELLVSGRLLVAFLLGALIGWEREHHGQEAGIRTFGLISLGACAFSLVSIFVEYGDQGRIAAQIVSGIGFLSHQFCMGCRNINSFFTAVNACDGGTKAGKRFRYQSATTSDINDG